MASRIHVLAWLSILLAPGCGGRTEPFEWASGTDAAGGTNAAGGRSANGGTRATGGTTLTGGTTSTGVVRSTGGAATGGTATGGLVTAGCPGNGGPSMVKLPEGYCIDSTEVTRDQYAAWLSTATSATFSGQDLTNCRWNATFVPDATCMASNQVCQGTGCGNHPQVCVDWCDAVAYCAGVGKRLCGRIGGGPNPYTDSATASMSQWYRACSSAGAYAYPYGNTYGGTICNSYEHWGASNYTTAAVASFSGCQSLQVGYAGAYDLSGNVWEWEDSCIRDNQTTRCHLRGGAFDESGGNIACGYGSSVNGDFAYNNIGLRCCAP